MGLQLVLDLLLVVTGLLLVLSGQILVAVRFLYHREQLNNDKLLNRVCKAHNGVLAD